MKTTIYDLLGMIKDGNAPKKIRFHCGEWVLTNKPYGYCKDYYSEDIDRYLFGEKWALTNNLNDEVEILDKENKIEKCIRRIISHNFCITDNNYKERFEVIRKSIEDNANEIEYTKAKINELIDEVNKLKENK